MTAEMDKQDTCVLFDGRTIVVECVFHTIVDYRVIAENMRQACAGPQLRLTVGSVERRHHDGAITTKSFVNTDEEVEVVAARIAGMSPKPSRVTAGIAKVSEAAKVWGELQRIQDGGD